MIAHDDSRVVTLGFTHSWNYFDRRLSTTIDRLGLEATWSRTRVSSYRNAMLVVRTDGTVVSADRLRAAVLDGLRASVDYLGGTSTSFALPAWRKWSRLLVDPHAPKGWPGQPFFSSWASITMMPLGPRT